ncbi:hypothetical protein D3C79_943990 [compost metagenome]
MINNDSQQIAPKIRTLPTNEVKFIVDKLVIFINTVPKTAISTPNPIFLVKLSFNRRTDKTAVDAGSVLVIIPASIAVVCERPLSIRTLNRKTPNNACRKIDK